MADAPPALDASARIVLLRGKEPFLHAQHTDTLRQALTTAHGEVDVIHFDGDRADAADVLDECRSFGLLAAHKLVVLDDADQLIREATRPLFEKYAENPCEGATLVLRSTTWRPGKLDKLIQKIGKIVKCEPFRPAQAVRWVVDHAKSAHGVKIGRDAAALLVERVGTGLGRLDSELAKLAVGKASVSVSDVVELVGATREQEFWSIQAPMLSGQPGETLAHLRSILENAPRDAYVPVTYACVDLARKLHAASRLSAQGAKGREIIKRLNLWGPSTDPILAVSQRLHPRVAAQLLQAAVRADLEQKTGVGKPARTLEILALRFARLVRSRTDNPS